MSSLQIEFNLAIWDITVMPKRIWQAIREEFWPIKTQLATFRDWYMEMGDDWDWNWNPAGPLMIGKGGDVRE